MILPVWELKKNYNLEYWLSLFLWFYEISQNKFNGIKGQKIVMSLIDFNII